MVYNLDAGGALYIMLATYASQFGDFSPTSSLGTIPPPPASTMNWATFAVSLADTCWIEENLGNKSPLAASCKSHPWTVSRWFWEQQFLCLQISTPPKDRTKGRMLLTGICVISERCLAAVRKASSDMWDVPVKTAASPMAGKMYALFACTHTSHFKSGSLYSRLLILRQESWGMKRKGPWHVFELFCSQACRFV